MIPRVEALRTSTLGWEIATPTELPLGGVLAHIISTHSKDRGLQWLQLNPGLRNRNSYRVAFGCVLAHIVSTHSKDRGLQWPKLWAGKTVGLGKRNSLDFRYAQ